MKTNRWLPRLGVHHRLAHQGLSRAWWTTWAVAWPPTARSQAPCAFVREESSLEGTVAVAARAVAVAAAGREGVGRAVVGAESGEDRRGWR